MFDQLFFRSDALTRQLSAPLVDERLLDGRRSLETITVSHVDSLPGDYGGDPRLLLCQGMDALGAFLPVVISPYRAS